MTQLASSGEDYLQALIDKQRQFSQFLPTISLSPTYTWLDHRSSSISASSRQGSTDVPLSGQYNVREVTIGEWPALPRRTTRPRRAPCRT